MTSDERFMLRCFDLASNGAGSVSPNPLVGCVITINNEIIGEGWHKQYGGPHAEVNAVASVRDQSLLTQATVYVNLEPCAHFGKTPPCADMLVHHAVKKVVICNTDPFKAVDGRGIQKLKSANIEVVTGVLEKTGRELNKRFFTYVEKSRPYIILKWAQTSDGFIGNGSGPLAVSNELSRQLTHRWRTEEDAFLVGRATAQQDNPQLNARYWTGRNPTRVVIDRFLKLGTGLHLFDGTQPTICYNTIKNESRNGITFVKITDIDFINGVVHDLYQRKIQSVVVEGGATTLQLFIDAGLWDEARVFNAPQALERGVAAAKLPILEYTSSSLSGDELRIFQNRNTSDAPVPVK